MEYFEAMKQIKKKQFSPVYLLYGTESFLVQDLKQKLIKYAINEEDKDTNISTYDLEEVSIQEVVTDAETYPFFGGTKLIFAQNPVFLKAKPDRTSIDHDVESLLRYLNEPAPESILVLIAPYDKIDERKKVSKLLKKNGTAVQCEAVKEWELKKWVDHLATNWNIEMEESVYDLIGQEVGPNLLALQSEIQKLALYVGPEGMVTYEIAEQLLSHSTETSGFKLVDAVINQELDKAIRIYKDLEKMKEEPIALLALLASQFRSIYQVKVLARKGYSQKQMAQQLKLHPYVVKMAQQREKAFSLEQLKHIMNLFTETDAEMKKGGMEKGLAFELLLFHPIKRSAVSV